MGERFLPRLHCDCGWCYGGRATCTSGAGQLTATGGYPIEVVFTGANACS